MSENLKRFNSITVKPYSFLLLVAIIASCRNEVLTQRAEYELPVASTLPDCIYSERRTNEAVYNWNGEVELFDSTSQTFHIKANRPVRIKLDACNLPEQFKKHGAKVQFSGEIKAVLPEEMRIALPFVIAEITSGK